MKRFVCLLGILSLMLSSCASKDKNEEKVERLADDEPFLDQPATPEAPKREAMYVYNKHPSKAGGTVDLKLNGEPLLLASGYVRLAGVVSGGRPIALVEVGGRGLALEVGDKVSGYRLVNIAKRGILLESEEE